MKKHLIRLARVLAFALVFVLAVNYLSLVFTPRTETQRFGDYSRISYSYRAEAPDTIDVFFVGDSSAYRSVSPMELWEKDGIAACMSGRGQQTAAGAYKIVRELFEKQNPKIVFIETGMLFPGKNEDIKKAAIEQNDQHSVIRRVFFSGPEVFDDIGVSSVGYYFPLAKYHSRWKELTLRDFVDLNTIYYSEYHGYVLSGDVEAYTGGDAYMGNENAAPAQMYDGAEKKLDAIVELCRSHGALPVLFTAPCAMSWNYGKHNATAAYAQKQSLTYRDYNLPGEIPELDWLTDSKDGGDHLNHPGAVKMTEHIRQDIQTLCPVPDRRTDPKYTERFDHDDLIYRQQVQKELAPDKE